jgi:hypothetical protein
MFGSLGLPELLVIGLVALIAAVWPLAFFVLGYYLGRRSMRNGGKTPDGATTSMSPHV